jgi:hypothetical protein
MNDLYSRYLSGWRVEQTASKDLAGNNKIETIWMNYPESQSTLFANEQ